MPKPRSSGGKPAARKKGAQPPKRSIGGQPGNTNTRKHGYYAAPTQKLETIEDIIADAQLRQAQLSALITHSLEAGAVLDDVVKLFGLHGQNASRLGRLLRDRRALSGTAADGIAGAIAQALDELSTEFGVQL